MDYLNFSRRLDELLARIRAGYLGQLVPFQDLLQGGAALPPPVLAERTAQALALCLARVCDLEDQDIARGYRWLHLVCRFLAGNCSKEDGNIYNLIQLTQTDHRTLKIVAEDYAFSHEDTEIFCAPPWYLEGGLELAAWELMGNAAQMEAELALETLDGVMIWSIN